MNHRTLFTLLSLYVATAISAQYTQTVRGAILDTDTRQPLIGATVMVIGSDPILGATTDVNGRYSIENVPAGRVGLHIRMVGYEEQKLSNLLVTSAKEFVLDIRMQRSLTQLNEVEIVAKERKDRSGNEMATVSARRINVEESSRTAGSFNDPARMASSFAGVSGDAAGDNNIVVRGNSSKGVLWRLEGMQIPNPNHFADDGTTGGPINVLNSDMIDNSDFYTGGFSAEYGNVLSAVFDMRLRTGNDRKHERTFKLGALGTDLTLEGPISQKAGSSYLVNYRYSTLSLLDQAGVVDFGGIPEYTDAAFKVKLPTKKVGTITIFGLGGKSNITEDDLGVTEDTLFSRGTYGSRMGVVGVTHTKTFGTNSYLYSTISLSGNGSRDTYDAIRADDDLTLLPDGRSDLAKWTTRVSSTYNQRFNNKLTARHGVIFSGEQFKMSASYWDDDTEIWTTELQRNGNANTYQAFSSWKWRMNQRWTLIAGLHALHYDLNDAFSIEPRAAVRFEPDPSRAITLGLGLHSKTEALATYLVQVTDTLGFTNLPNQDLDLTRAAHAVLGFEQLLAEDLQLKAEVYYQYLYDLPVANDLNDEFSLSNTEGWFTDRDLTNEGTGYNAGVELSLEKYFSRNYHFLITGSFFESKYKPLDGKWYNSRFNLGTVANVMAGKEWKMGEAKGKDRTINFGFRYAIQGGQYRAPIDLEASIAEDDEILGDAWSKKGDPLHRVDVVLSYRVGRPKVSHEIKFDIQNVMNASTNVYFEYDKKSRTIETDDQLAILPVFLYTLRF